jgi:hypothetical protein
VTASAGAQGFTRRRGRQNRRHPPVFAELGAISALIAPNGIIWFARAHKGENPTIMAEIAGVLSRVAAALLAPMPLPNSGATRLNTEAAKGLFAEH